MRKWTTAVAVGLVLTLGLAACGDDDDGDSATDTTAAAANFKDYCDKSLALETLPEPEIDFGSASEAEQKEAVKKYMREVARPRIDAIKGSVPPEIQADAQVMFAGFDQLEASGDFEEFETATKAAEAKIHVFDLASCGWQKVDVKGIDYAFEGIPATLKAGPASFDLTNAGKELHEAIVVKKKAGVMESFDAIFKLDQAKAQEKIENVASSFAAPGEGDYGVANLVAGEYAVVCFIPVGLTSEDARPAEDAPPHIARGMKSEFKVS